MQSPNTSQTSGDVAASRVQRRKSRPLKSMADLILDQGQFGRKVTSVSVRFHRSYEQTPTGCWEWKFRLSVGYGEMRCARYSVKAHRVSWILHNGEIPDGLLVCHSCNNKKCVNPNHLYLGTALQNRGDADEDGLTPKGSRMPRAKLTEESAWRIRQLNASGQVTYIQLAVMFGVSKSVVADVIKFRTWKHVA